MSFAPGLVSPGASVRGTDANEGMCVMGARFHLLAATAAAAIVAAQAAQAQSQSEPVQMLEVSVSATVIATPLDQIGSSVTVITADDIARTQRRTLPDIRNSVPGVNVVQTGGPGGST